jgi:hypothetical protein
LDKRVIEMVLQGVVVERRTPYGEGVIDMRICDVIRRHGGQVVSPIGVATLEVPPLELATDQPGRRDA